MQAFSLNPLAFVWLGLAMPATPTTPTPIGAPMGRSTSGGGDGVDAAGAGIGADAEAGGGAGAAGEALAERRLVTAAVESDSEDSPVETVETVETVENDAHRVRRVVVGVLRGLRTNPFLLMVAAGLCYNGIFGRSLPFWIDSVTKLLAAPFSGRVSSVRNVP